jgi:hypothetical protein
MMSVALRGVFAIHDDGLAHLGRGHQSPTTFNSVADALTGRQERL